MAKFDLGKGMKKLQNAVDVTKSKVKSVASDYGVVEILQDASTALKNATQDVNVEEIKSAFQDTVKSAKETINSFSGTDSEETTGDDTTDSDVESLNIRIISSQCALKIIYFLMAADGEIFHSEEEKFDMMGKEIDPDFAEHREKIISVCQAQLDKVIDPADYYDVLQDGVEDALLASRQTADTFITPKLLVWNLLTIAYSDENYDEAERKLIKYIVRKTNIDKAVFLEMESSILTLMDIEKELAWIKTTNRPYLVIEAMVNELADRKIVIFESVKDLISL